MRLAAIAVEVTKRVSVICLSPILAQRHAAASSQTTMMMLSYSDAGTDLQFVSKIATERA
jgi:hypothetical protein